MSGGTRQASLAGLQIDPAAFEGLSERDRAAVADELAALEAAFRENPLLKYNHPSLSVPHPRQIEFHRPLVGEDGKPFWPPLRAFFGGNRCLAEGTLVRVADGSARPIEDIQPGELVLGSHEDGVCRPVRVLGVFSNGPRTCFRFRFGKRGTEEEIVATADHRVSAFHEKGYRAVVPLGLMDGTTRSRWSVQRVTRFDGWDGVAEPFAMLYGLLLGDGCTVNGRVSFACADPEVLALLEQQCEKFGVVARANPANPIQYYLSAGRSGKPNPLFVQLKSLGMACYAHEKRLPDMSNWHNRAVGELLAGLFVTDGSVWKASEGWRAGFTSVSQGLVEDVKRELEQRFGVYGSTLLAQDRTKHGKKRTEYSLTIGNYKSLERLSFSLPAVAKLKKLRMALCEWDGKKSDAARLRYRGRDEAGVLSTYDLHVDHPDHLFVLANGMIVHNSGKTTAGMVDTLIQAVDDDVVPDHLKAFKRWQPPFKCRIITPDFGDTHEVVLEKIREWCPKKQLRDGGFDRAFDKQKRVLWFKNGSRLHFNSNVQDREQLGGSDLHRVVYDEEPRQDLRIESLTRLIDHDGEEIFAMTPLEGMSWLFDEVYEPWERGEMDPRDGRVLVVDMDDNPHISQAGKARALAAYPEHQREARKSGRFVSFAGLIYPQWSPHRHVVPAIDRVPPGAEVFRGIDPGYRHMCAVLYCYLTPDDEMVVFDEIALAGATIKQVCREMELLDSKWGTVRDDGTRIPLVVNWTVIDPAARNKNGQTGRSDQAEFSDHGVMTIPGQNAVGAGINRVKERLDADRFKVTANCHELISEFRKYRWVKDTKRTEDKAPERPVKKNDHLLDCARYIVAQRPLAPKRDVDRPSDSYKDRALRHSLKRLSRLGRVPTHDSGPGIWA